MRILRATLLLLAAGCAAFAAPGTSGYRVVANRANPLTSLTRAEAARLFLKKTTNWPDGKPVLVIDQERGSAVRQAFSRDVHQKDADAVAAYWQTLVFSGRDVPPSIARTDAEVIAFVMTSPGAIGYVAAGAETDSVKVLTLR
ncbi:MAG: substrate-binding domain-containing protein [Vicinamibacteria bacterium]